MYQLKALFVVTSVNFVSLQFQSFFLNFWSLAVQEQESPVYYINSLKANVSFKVYSAIT